MRRPDYDRRVAVTGLGVISPVGNDKATAWANLVNGVSGLDFITHFDTSRYEAKFGGEVADFDAAIWMDAKAARRSESSMHFGVAAAKQALADSGFELDDENRTEVGRRVRFGGRRAAALPRPVRDAPGTRATGRVADLHRQRADGQHLGDDRHRDGGHRPQHVRRVGVRDRHAQRR